MLFLLNDCWFGLLKLYFGTNDDELKPLFKDCWIPLENIWSNLKALSSASSKLTGSLATSIWVLYLRPLITLWAQLRYMSAYN